MASVLLVVTNYRTKRDSRGSGKDTLRNRHFSPKSGRAGKGFWGLRLFRAKTIPLGVCRKAKNACLVGFLPGFRGFCGISRFGSCTPCSQDGSKKLGRNVFKAFLLFSLLTASRKGESG
jgi:hypothetical protein